MPTTGIKVVVTIVFRSIHAFLYNTNILLMYVKKITQTIYYNYSFSSHTYQFRVHTHKVAALEAIHYFYLGHSEVLCDYFVCVWTFPPHFLFRKWNWSNFKNLLLKFLCYIKQQSFQLQNCVWLSFLRSRCFPKKKKRWTYFAAFLLSGVWLILKKLQILSGYVAHI